MSWLKGKRGYEAADKAVEKIEEEMAGRVYRLWMKPEAEATVIFIDDDPPIIDEHQLKIGGKWTNWATDLGVMNEPCPACEGDRPYTIGFYTIMEVTDFTLQDGTHVVNPRRALGAKFTLLKHLKKERQLRDGSLKGCMYRVFRTDGSASNTGDEWEFVRRLSDEEIREMNPEAEPIDFEEYLAPKSAEEIRKMLSKAEDKDDARSGSATGGNRTGEIVYNEEDIAF